MTEIDMLAQALSSAERILVGAGAGLSAAAGLSYLDSAVFREYYPDMWRLGYRCQYELVGMRDTDWTMGRKWAWWATHVNYVRYVFPAAPLYAKLRALLEGRDYFVVTSNADRQFMRGGFDESRLFEYQGNYDNMGCSRRCTTKTWYNKPSLDRILEKLDHQRFECPEEALPRCPYCGALAEMCFRGEDYARGRDRYLRFLEESEGKTLCLLELGVGFNTPGVIRWPFEKITRLYPLSQLFRVNAGYRERYGDEGDVQMPRDLGARAVLINQDAGTVIQSLYARMRSAEGME